MRKFHCTNLKRRSKLLAFAKLQGTIFALDSKKPRQVLNASGGDALRGNTRPHPEHDG